jgi:hypothetical protein
MWPEAGLPGSGPAVPGATKTSIRAAIAAIPEGAWTAIKYH